ncbi:MAG TPA: M20/M25/M40 family metallo-hydrolase, partial [Gemmatimonadota bacterium]|nr:M20/M25/M40 family metallo-hydrolase [Gemmatimonadota bacterium]
MTVPRAPEIDLLAELVSIPSVSGEEAEVAGFIERTAREWGLDVEADDAGIRIVVPGRADGPTLALVTHVDVVPPGDGWTRDPWSPEVADGRLYGRGSGDAKASVAAMLSAARDVAAAGGPPRGRLLVLLGLSEETKDTTMPRLVERAGSIDAAVVGEPTNLDLAVAQRGLLRIDLLAEGEQRHAGRADEEPYVNAIQILAR